MRPWLALLLIACGDAGGEATTADAGRDASTVVDAAVVDDARPDAAGALQPDARVSKPFVYVGATGGKIHIFELDPVAATLTPRGTATTGGNPSFLAVDPTHRFLFAVDESGGKVVALAIDAPTGALTVLNSVSSSGSGPAHLSVDRTGRWVLAANYDGGNVAVIPVATNGRVSAAVDTRTAGSQPHQILTDAQNRWALVPCKGSDRINQYAFDPTLGRLTSNAVAQADTAAGAGPRHLAFHPSGPYAYVVAEKNSTVTAYGFDAATGRLSALHTLSTLPSGVSVANTGAEIVVHPSGKFVYASNRGHDSIVAYAVAPATGRLTLVGHTATGGQTPRSFTLDDTGTLLLAGNQKSGTVTALRVNLETGALTALGQVATVTGVEFVGVVTLP